MPSLKNSVTLLLLMAFLFDAGTILAADRTQIFNELHEVAPSDTAADFPVDHMGHFSGSRVSEPSAKGFLDFIAFTYTKPGEFNLQVSFDRTSKEEGKRVPHADLFQMTVNLDLDRYKQIFESSADVTLPRWRGIIYEYTVTARSAGNRRTIKIYQETFPDAEVPVITRKGEATITMVGGEVASVHMVKWARRSVLNPAGMFKRFAKVFDDTLTGMTRTATGLSLRDEGEVGRAQSEDQMQRALATQSPEDYHAAAGR